MMGGVNRFASSSIGRTMAQEAMGAVKGNLSANAKNVGEVALGSIGKGGVQKAMSSSVSGSPMMGRFKEVGKEIGGMTRDALVEEGFKEAIGKGDNNTLLPAAGALAQKFGAISGAREDAFANSGSLFDQVGKRDFLNKSSFLPT